MCKFITSRYCTEPEEGAEDNASSVTQSDSSVTQSDISGNSDMRIEYIESEQFRLFVHYRGKCTEEFARSLHKCYTIMTLCKLKTVTPTLKRYVKMFLRSKVLYKNTCPRCNACYVAKPDDILRLTFWKIEPIQVK